MQKIRQLEPDAINWEEWCYVMKKHFIKFKTAKELSTKPLTSELILETKKIQKMVEWRFYVDLVWVIDTGEDFEFLCKVWMNQNQ